MISHTIDANTEQRQASHMARHGNRYYPVDETYDKRVYENTWVNYVKIVACLFAFWIANAMHWWGVFCLGIVDSEALGYYSIGCFFFTAFFLAGILISGGKANKIKREQEFWIEKIAERKAELAEQQKLDARKKKEEEAAREDAERAAKEKAAAARATPTPVSTNYNIQDGGRANQVVEEQPAPPTADNKLIRDDRA